MHCTQTQKYVVVVFLPFELTTLSRSAYLYVMYYAVCVCGSYKVGSSVATCYAYGGISE